MRMYNNFRARNPRSKSGVCCSLIFSVDIRRREVFVGVGVGVVRACHQQPRYKLIKKDAVMAETRAICVSMGLQLETEDDVDERKRLDYVRGRGRREAVTLRGRTPEARALLCSGVPWHCSRCAHVNPLERFRCSMCGLKNAMTATAATS